MKTNIAHILVLAALVPSICQCSKNLPEKTATDTIEANVSDTKVSLSPGDGCTTLAWQAGDKIRVIGTTAEDYTINEGFTDHKATFSGTPVEGTSFDIIYPAKYSTKEALLSRSYTGQVQNGNGNTAHLEFNALIEDTDDYHTVNFCEGTTNGVLKLVVKMPDDVTEVSSITLSTADAIFYGDNSDSNPTNSLSLSFGEGTVVDANHKLTAYLMTSMQPAIIAAGTKLTLGVTTVAGSYFKKVISNPGDIPVNGGATLAIDISDVTVLTRTLAGAGTEANPYRIYDKGDMLLVKKYLAKKDSDIEATYFKLMNDVDMGGVNFEPLSNGSKYYKIDFSSDGSSRKTLSNVNIPDSKYTSLFGVLNGKLHDVNFDNVKVKVTNSDLAAVVCAYLGGVNNSIIGNVENVNITNSSVDHTYSSGSGTGIVCSKFARGKIENVVIDNTNTVNQKITTQIASKNGLGGIAAYSSQDIPSGQEYWIKDCTCNAAINCKTSTAAPETKTNFGLGGVIGIVSNKGILISGCSFGGSFSVNSSINFYHFGGIVGLDTSAGLTIEGCTNNADISLNHHYVGGILGRSSGSNTKISGCRNNGALSTAKSQDRNFIAGITGEVGTGSSISGCSNYGSVTANTKGYKSQNVAGIVGYPSAAITITQCANYGPITSLCDYIGGIIGRVRASSSISECFNKGNISGSQKVGGIAGELQTSASDKKSSISNCYSTGNITVTDQFGGGIVGDLYANNNISACYAAGVFTGGRSVGTIIGRCSNGGSTTAAGQSHGNTIKYVVAWPTSLSATGTNKQYSSGAVTGFSATKTSYDLCYRRDDTDVNYSFSNCPSGVSAPFNQGRTTSNVTTGITNDTTNYPYWYPYHANSVSKSSYPNVTKVVEYFNKQVTNAWNTSIWDLSSGFPTLINNPE